MSTRHHPFFGTRARSNALQAFTLIELLVVVAIIGLLISILLPGLRRAREQAKNVVCLTNLRSMAQGTVLYSTDAKRLPGALHPAVYRNQGIDGMLANGANEATAKYFQARQLTHQLRRVFNDSHTFENSVTDQVATCPVIAGLFSDSDHSTWVGAAGKSNPGSGAFPAHYALNNYGSATSETPSGPNGNPRITDPSFYFGYSSPNPSNAAEKALMDINRSKPLERINRASEEWMMADAWFRSRQGPPAFQQEGPYQSEWSGEFMPYFAPHNNRVGSYAWPGTAPRRTIASDFARANDDVGSTNTAFFDGHAEPVRSKYLVGGAGFTVLYGFPGTVNQANLKPAERLYIWKTTPN